MRLGRSGFYRGIFHDPIPTLKKGGMRLGWSAFYRGIYISSVHTLTNETSSPNESELKYNFRFIADKRIK